MMRTLTLVTLFLGSSLLSLQAVAQDNPPPAAPPPAPAEAAPAAPAAAPPPAGAPAAPEKKKGGGPSLSLSPEAPQVGGLVVSPAEPSPVVEEAPTSEWKFDVTGYFRAPMRMSWGPATSADPNGGDPGTQLRSPPFVPDANYIDWRYTNSLVGPWTELNFHYGNDRVKATIQIASYNLTDPGFRRLEANLGINQAFLTLLYPELFNNEDLHLTVTVGGFTNRYGAAGRYDAGKYETYLFGRTHVMGWTLNLAYDVNDITAQVEWGFGGKLESIPFYSPPGVGTDPRARLAAWEPYPGPVAQEPTFIHHAHIGVVYKKQLILGGHWIDTFANGNELSTSYTMMTFNTAQGGRPSTDPRPNITTWGFDAKLLGGVLGDGYVGFSHLSATNSLFISDAIEVLHSFGGWQLHDNYFGPPGGTETGTGSINTVEAQYIFSFGQLFHYPQAFWGDGPDLIAGLFGMYNSVNVPTNAAYTHGKLKAGAELTYIPIAWLGMGGRYDLVQPNLDDNTQNFSVFSPRLIFRTAFVTHEQILVQYSRYFYGSNAAHGMFPYNNQPGGAMITNGADKNAFTVAAIIWF